MDGGGRQAHDEAMATANDTSPPTPPPPPEAPRPRLTRSSDDKVVSGLCGGLGRYFGVDPVVFRIAFVVISLAGGTGLVLYLVGWALVPSDRGDTPSGQGVARGRPEQVLAAVLAAIGIVVLLDELFEGHDRGVPLGLALVAVGALLLWSLRSREAPPPPGGSEGPVPVPPAPPAEVAGRAEPNRSPSTLVPVTLSLLAVLAGGLALLDATGVVHVSLVVGLALTLLVVGGALLVASRWGRGRMLIPVGLVLSAVLCVVALADVPVRGGVGERTYRPLSLADVDTPYRLAAGDLTVDLGAVDLTGTSSRVVATVGAGTLTVVVPDDATVVVDGEVGAGELRVLGRYDDGLGLDRRVVDAGTEGGGRLLLRVRVGMGQLEVRRAAA
jgi:phage shock protein PspC (stress-responsive transcriptional regulator)